MRTTKTIMLTTGLLLAVAVLAPGIAAQGRSAGPRAPRANVVPVGRGPGSTTTAATNRAGSSTIRLTGAAKTRDRLRMRRALRRNRQPVGRGVRAARTNRGIRANVTNTRRDRRQAVRNQLRAVMRQPGLTPLQRLAAAVNVASGQQNQATAIIMGRSSFGGAAAGSAPAPFLGGDAGTAVDTVPASRIDEGQDEAPARAGLDRDDTRKVMGSFFVKAPTSPRQREKLARNVVKKLARHQDELDEGVVAELLETQGFSADEIDLILAQASAEGRKIAEKKAALEAIKEQRRVASALGGLYRTAPKNAETRMKVSEQIARRLAKKSDRIDLDQAATVLEKKGYGADEALAIVELARALAEE